MDLMCYESPSVLDSVLSAQPCLLAPPTEDDKRMVLKGMLQRQPPLLENTTKLTNNTAVVTALVSSYENFCSGNELVSTRVVHLATHLFVMWTVSNVASTHTYFAAQCAALWVALKWDNNQWSDMHNFLDTAVNNKVLPWVLVSAERDVLAAAQFRVHVALPIDFVTELVELLECTKEQHEKMTKLCLHVTQHPTLQQYSAGLLGAACVAYVVPIKVPTICELLDCNLDDLVEIKEVLRETTGFSKLAVSLHVASPFDFVNVLVEVLGCTSIKHEKMLAMCRHVNVAMQQHSPALVGAGCVVYVVPDDGTVICEYLKFSTDELLNMMSKMRMAPGFSKLVVSLLQ